ncbi:hypothetical protein QTP88_026045 [Uroleucon formosanum]
MKPAEQLPTEQLASDDECCQSLTWFIPQVPSPITAILRDDTGAAGTDSWTGNGPRRSRYFRGNILISLRCVFHDTPTHSTRVTRRTGGERTYVAAEKRKTREDRSTDEQWEKNLCEIGLTNLKGALPTCKYYASGAKENFLDFFLSRKPDDRERRLLNDTETRSPPAEKRSNARRRRNSSAAAATAAGVFGPSGHHIITELGASPTTTATMGRSAVKNEHWARAADNNIIRSLFCFLPVSAATNVFIGQEAQDLYPALGGVNTEKS